MLPLADYHVGFKPVCSQFFVCNKGHSLPVFKDSTIHLVFPLTFEPWIICTAASFHLSCFGLWIAMMRNRSKTKCFMNLSAISECSKMSSTKKTMAWFTYSPKPEASLSSKYEFVLLLWASLKQMLRKYFPMLSKMTHTIHPSSEEVPLT